MFVADAIDGSNQVSEIRFDLVKIYIKDRANAPINVTKSELEQYLEESQFPLNQKMSYLLIFCTGGNTMGQSLQLLQR